MNLKMKCKTFKFI